MTLCAKLLNLIGNDTIDEASARARRANLLRRDKRRYFRRVPYAVVYQNAQMPKEIPLSENVLKFFNITRG